MRLLRLWLSKDSSVLIVKPTKRISDMSTRRDACDIRHGAEHTTKHNKLQ